MVGRWRRGLLTRRATDRPAQPQGPDEAGRVGSLHYWTVRRPHLRRWAWRTITFVALVAWLILR